MLLPPALGFSPHPPVSVYGTGICHTIAAFLDSWNPALRYFCSLRITALHYRAGFLTLLLLRLRQSSHSWLAVSFCVPTVLMTDGTGISTCCPSTTLFSLALGPDFPRADQLYSGNLDIRPGGFSPPSRYSFRHSLFPTLHGSLRYRFAALAMLLYHSPKGVLSFGVVF